MTSLSAAVAMAVVLPLLRVSQLIVKMLETLVIFCSKFLLETDGRKDQKMTSEWNMDNFFSQAHSSHDLLTPYSRDIYSQFVTWSLPRVFIVTTISVLDKIKMILAAIMCMCNEMIPDPSLGNGGHSSGLRSCAGKYLLLFFVFFIWQLYSFYRYLC